MSPDRPFGRVGTIYELRSTRYDSTPLLDTPSDEPFVGQDKETDIQQGKTVDIGSF